MSRDLKIGIISGIISGLLLIIFIQPILSYFSEIILNITKIVTSHLSNSIYRDAARNNSGMLLEFWIAISILFLILFFISDRISIRDKIDRDDKFFLFIKKLEFFKKGLMIGLGFTIILGGLAVVSLFENVEEISSSFHSKLEILSPYIPDQKAKELKAKFAGMRSEEDYNFLNHQLDDIAAKNQVKLPPK